MSGRTLGYRLGLIHGQQTDLKKHAVANKLNNNLQIPLASKVENADSLKAPNLIGEELDFPRRHESLAK